METTQQTSDPFDENQSFQVIKEMIQISQKKLKNDGLLFILWGWVMFYSGLSGYIVREVLLSHRFERFLGVFGKVFGLLVVAYTVYYIWRQRKKVQTYIGISLRYVWISMVGCFVLINLILYNVLHQVNFELQHPLFMVMMAFSVVVTGGILRYKLIIIGGILFGLIALISSYFRLSYQLLFESCAWFIAFVIPGHYLYATRKR
ncbi:MAG: hypothetical protein A2W86_08540 [Bacteroidetes bacterium GWD2_45_23]|nr:MAG: hypothetical protein A2W87_09980 [Bacteroidetes bacterium GWC2_46_850]OFX86997.1 MAG: hypothetical protein A2W86_08540 [Bacteroidetes bacterium GWD2_45_23]HBB00510.1 hypothetical protein [Porphyromonadaceae bacterium]HCC17566.1 hypothetical protein [Porphyromonadaceae bacterium]